MAILIEDTQIEKALEKHAGAIPDCDTKRAVAKAVLTKVASMTKKQYVEFIRPAPLVPTGIVTGPNGQAPE